MENDYESLRPYPIDISQDKVIEKIVFAKRKLIPQLTSFLFTILTYPLKLLSKYKNKKLAEKNKTNEEIDAKEIPPIHISTSTSTMDLKFYYIIRYGKIWFKPIGAHCDSSWKLFGDNGFIDQFQTPLISISVDGDNILAVDENQIIHYAKSNQIICKVSFDCPQWEIIESRVKWTQKWFNMDGVSLVVNLFKNPILKSLKNSRNICMSHKGPDTMYYTDMKGKKHPDPYVGVTTIYCLNEDGTRIFFADPWLQNKFENELTTPEDGQFIAESMATSGSTLFLIQRGRNEFGKEINKMYTRFADFDSIGSNPALASTYNPNNNVPLIRYLPSEDWIRQPYINIQGKTRLTKDISIYQIGWGQNNRQLRVQGTDANGNYGFYFKNIYDKQWNFQITNDVIISENEFLSQSISFIGFEKGSQICFDYSNGQFNSNIKDIHFENIILEKFSHRGLNERGLHTKLILILDKNNQISIPLYARRGWRSLIGLSKSNLWKLVIPLKYFQNDNYQIQFILEKIFQNKFRHNVYVYETKQEIFITNTFCSRTKFKFTFKIKSI
ncbi:unnamed protein product [Adineta steineri]|uniref:Uncharacterized protein n=1 Tax=Adineta steineri TaxID=433720 RepID=A0A815R8P6_9BILA|nr:unnamed protein product [Adineta steineri]CAF1474127.1 unnamed protein product [Adineta steineri]